ncbi:MAG: site-specific DNA-methyltransferase [Methylacidiphilales bacterium]|nr:site-specific DNA-methyltransferase [Candidatus Methylacidiphilales bacterium]
MPRYTYRYPGKENRHRWFKFKQAYSKQIVEDILRSQEVCSCRILDPFCGSGTTVLCAAYMNYPSIAIDINPFLTWLTRVKTDIYDKKDIEKCLFILNNFFNQDDLNIVPYRIPDMHNIEKWWSESAIDFLGKLLSLIYTQTDTDEKARNLLLVAFCRTALDLSNVTFGHHSMSLKQKHRCESLAYSQYKDAFRNNLEFITQTAKYNPSCTPEVTIGDAKEIGYIVKDPVRLIITSPPYVNRMSYIRELRPYMYWLDYLQNREDAGQLDWLAIGGTWGQATSKLIEWQPQTDDFRTNCLLSVLENIKRVQAKSSLIVYKYIEKYFHDIWLHFSSIQNILLPSAELYYIIGNSFFYGFEVPTHIIYSEMLKKLGFVNIEIRMIRKRNSNVNLFEFLLTAKWCKN